MVYFIADTHLYHRGIIQYDNRPFCSVEEMNQTIIRNWNNRVNKNDEIYILGDFIKGDSQQWVDTLDRLKGHKILIQGNHDPQCFEPAISARFAEIANYKEIVVEGNKVIMCHYPIFFHRADYKENVWMLFGHIHNGHENNFANQIREQLILSHKEIPDPRGQFINVGCMMPYMNYTPRTLNELIFAWRHM